METRKTLVMIGLLRDKPSGPMLLDKSGLLGCGSLSCELYSKLLQRGYIGDYIREYCQGY